MIFLLDRLLEYGAQGTLGEMYGKGATKRLCWTLEPPWLGNARGSSRIPPGSYRMVPHDGTQFKGTWALVGHGVAHFEDRDADRYTIVIHAGNTVADTRGCIMPGSDFGVLRELLAVKGSEAAFERVMQATGRNSHQEEHWLVIRDRLGGFPAQ